MKVEELHKGSDFASATVRISSLLVAPARFAEALDDSLGILGDVTQAGRAYVFELRPNDQEMDNTHEWCAENVRSQMEELQGLPYSAVPWWVEQLEGGTTIHIPDVSELPPEASAERELLQAQDIKSLVVLPLYFVGRLGGFIGLDNVTSARPWTDNDISLLRLASEVIGAAMARHAAQERARESEEIHRTLFESSPDAIIMCDLDCTALKLNRSAVEMLGYEKSDELVGRSCFDLLAEEDRIRAHEYTRTTSETGDQKGGRFTALRRDGTSLKIEVNISLMRDSRDRRTGFILVARDITEQLQLQSQLAQSNRLASVGMLAAGVAHEINNPLTFVLYNVTTIAEDLSGFRRALSRIKRDLDASFGEERAAELMGEWSQNLIREMQKRAQSATTGALRIRTIVNDLRTFSRVEDEKRSFIDVNELLDSVINMARNEIKYRAKLLKDYSVTPPFLASEGRLFQVFLNLVVNAAQAIEDGDADNNEIRIRTSSNEDELIVEISDTGCGIPPEVIERVFDPFFSSKPIGVGSGLGLSITHSIVASFGGRIDVVSDIEEGSTFTVRLPLAKNFERPTTKKESEMPSSAERAKGRILVIDDEPQVGKVLSKLLGREHAVAFVTSGREAMHLIEEDQDFDILLCDVIMPDVSGIDLYWWLNERYPALGERIVFMTAAAFTPRARAFFERTDIPCLAKPFQVKDVIALVQEILRTR